mmetsp:Transcript_42551/g.71012  ORF Transcript_42551/g.71012 Transcript_42551/m.71012 type:complete len:200 (-) Transcript_42551:3441-4040(-)
MMVLLGKVHLQDEVFVVQDLLAVVVLHKDPERLNKPVHLLVPLEIRRHREVHAKHAPGDGLHGGGELEPRELVHVAMDGLAHLREADELANLLRGQVVVALPRQVFLLYLLQDLGGNALELAERGLAPPHALVDHLAEAERLVRQLRPPALEHDLVQRPHEAARALRDVHHVRQQRQPVQLQVGDVRLQQHVYLGRGLL